MPKWENFYWKIWNNETNGNRYFEYNNKRYNVIFDNGKLLSNDKSILSKNKIKFGKNEIIINSNENMNDILCYKCQNLLDNPIQCNECYIYYCNDCIVDEN